MSEPATLTCVDCKEEFPRPAGPWGANAKRCTTCRRDERRNRSRASADGPTHVIADTFRSATPEWHERLAGLAVHHATGMPVDFATLCVEAVNVLLGQGETPSQIRARLNPNPFGRLRTVEDGQVVGVKGRRSLAETIMGEFAA